METVYLAGGCLWGVQHFFDTVPGVQETEAGRANGATNSLDGPYDGYAECVKVDFDEKRTNVSELMAHLFEIIDPYSRNKQGVDVGKKYRTGLYSTEPRHLEEARAFIDSREDRDKIVVEVLPLTNYVRSAEEHQHHLERHPEDCSYCHIPDAVLNKYRNKSGLAEKTGNDFTIKEMLAMQQALQEKYKDKWEPIGPEAGKHKLLWMLGEVGEVIDVIKKNGDQKAVEDAEVRQHLVEEMADVLMYYNDVLLCYGISEQELKEAYTAKFEKNMKRW